MAFLNEGDEVIPNPGYLQSYASVANFSKT
jgi:hypothetical protein